MEAAKTIAQAFISCRLDYCNSLLYSISDSLIQRLQSVQNAAARLVTGTRRSDHTPSSSSVALVTSPPANSYQDCLLCFPGNDRPSNRLPRRRLPPHTRTVQTPLLELVSPPPPKVHAIRWQKFFGCLSTSLEWSTHLRSETSLLTVSKEVLRPVCLHWCDEIYSV